MRILVLSLLFIIPFTGYCQQPVKEPAPELSLHEGLLYSTGDIQHLKRTADSLNLRFLQCETNPVYHSLPQTQATLITLRIKKKKAPRLESRLKEGVPLQTVLSEFPRIEVKDSIHVILARQTRYYEEAKKYDTVLYSGDANGLYPTDLPLSSNTGNLLYERNEDNISRRKYYSIKVWNIAHPFSSMVLGQEYAKMIQYVDCMTDTTMTLMLHKGAGDNKPFDTLRLLVLKNNPHKRKEEAFYFFDEADLQYLHGEFYKNDKVTLLLTNAIREAVEKGNGNEVLEKAVTGICSPDTILLMKRSRTVYGSCSMDDSPRMHARDIAVLASQTHQWPVFIRAHLNIMNDYFNRMSDGSYAQARRKTYLRELELLDIPAHQLLLGTVFRADQLPKFHYFGDLSRIGRAFAESSYAVDFEKQVKSFIKDEQLDPFNKCLFFMLYASYCHHQPDESARKVKIEELRKESATYPEYIRAGINEMTVAK